jgi:uncharacterized MnhB-related membrane protein
MTNNDDFGLIAMRRLRNCVILSGILGAIFAILVILYVYKG